MIYLIRDWGTPKFLFFGAFCFCLLILSVQTLNAPARQSPSHEREAVRESPSSKEAAGRQETEASEEEKENEIDNSSLGRVKKFLNDTFIPLLAH